MTRSSQAPYEIVGEPRTGGPFVFTCEHASQLLPEWEAETADRRLLEDHWGWDIGAADLTRVLCQRTGSCAVLSRFSRLVCDPNRDPAEPSFLVKQVEGQPLSFNRNADESERRRRRRLYFDPYHDAIDRTIAERKAAGTPVHLCSIHSFAPVYLERARPMEVGVLFDAHDRLARRLERALGEHGFETARNAPYSGMDGLIYAAQRHGRRHDIAYLELEVRHDLIETQEKALATGERIASALACYAPDLAGFQV